MKMERAKLQRRINKDLKRQLADNDSQSCASFSDESDSERPDQDAQRQSSRKRVRLSKLEEIKEDVSDQDMKAITPIQESENEEEGPHPSKSGMFNRGTTTFSKDHNFGLDDDSFSSQSKSQDRSNYGEAQSTVSNSKMTRSKRTSEFLARSSTKAKGILRMGSVRSDSDHSSRKFKFRSKKTKIDEFVQTDDKHFQKFVNAKMHQYLKQK
mmetsp:Transcript_41530/g.47911  ORF Transcript_41530/g.47911 Transcript_41530/m.47911 type:complete len:211 (-) Transcript_41530:701-1333(-)